MKTHEDRNLERKITWASSHQVEFHAQGNTAPNMSSPPEFLLVQCEYLLPPSSFSFYKSYASLSDAIQLWNTLMVANKNHNEEESAKEREQKKNLLIFYLSLRCHKETQWVKEGQKDTRHKHWEIMKSLY